MVCVKRKCFIKVHRIREMQICAEIGHKYKDFHQHRYTSQQKENINTAPGFTTACVEVSCM